MKTYQAFVRKANRLGSELRELDCENKREFRKYWSLIGATVTSKIIEKGKENPVVLVKDGGKRKMGTIE